MEVILLERVEKLGQMGDIVNVKPGFARNFLLPREKALRATAENKKRFETQRAQLETENLKQREEADAVATKMAGLSVVLIRQAGEAGHLYGSVNARDIAAAVTDAGFTVSRNQVNLEHPIKTLGLYTVSVSLHPEVSTTVTANVARSADEAQIQASTGHAVNKNEDDDTDVADAILAEQKAAAAEEFGDAEGDADVEGEAGDAGEE